MVEHTAMAIWAARVAPIAHAFWENMDCVSAELFFYTHFRVALSTEEKDAYLHFAARELELKHAMFNGEPYAKIEACSGLCRALTPDLLRIMLLTAEQACELMPAEHLASHVGRVQHISWCLAAASDCMTRLLVLKHYAPANVRDEVACMEKAAEILAALPGFRQCA